MIKDINKNINNNNNVSQTDNKKTVAANIGRGSKNIIDLAKRFENKDELQSNLIINKNIAMEISNNDIQKINNNEINSFSNATDLSVIPRGSGRVSTILNRLTHQVKEEENNEKKLGNELNSIKKGSEMNAIENNNILNINLDPKEIMKKINSNLHNNQNTKSQEKLNLKNDLFTKDKKEEINTKNQKENVVENKEIEKISDDSMIQDFKNLLKFKKKSSDPFDMEVDLNYKDKVNLSDLEFFPINSKDIITFEEAEGMKIIENGSYKSEDLIVKDLENEIKYVENVNDILIAEPKISDNNYKSEEPEFTGRNSTFKFKPKNSLGKKPLNFKIENVENKLYGVLEKNEREDSDPEKEESFKNQDIEMEIELFKNVSKKKKREIEALDPKVNNNITENAKGNIDEIPSKSNKMRNSVKNDFQSNCKKEKTESNFADENKSNLSDNLSRSSIISVDRKSVKYYVKKVEKTIKKQKLEIDSVEKQRRNTHSNKTRKRNIGFFNENLEEMREILKKLKLQTSENEKEFLEKNRNLLKQMGVHEKDMLSIQELTNHFEEQLNPKNKVIKEANNEKFNNNLNLVNKENSTCWNENLKIDDFNNNEDFLRSEIKKRNTTNHAKKLYENVSQILEEKEEDSSFLLKDKERISDNNKQWEKTSFNNIRSLVSPNNASHKISGFDINNNNSLNMMVNNTITVINKNPYLENISENEKFYFDINSNFDKSIRSKNLPLKKTNFSDRINNNNSPNLESKLGIRNLNSNDMDMFNPEKDQIECISPKNIFTELNRNKKAFDEIQGVNKPIKKEENNIFAYSFNSVDEKNKNKDKFQEEPKIFENNNLYSSNAQEIIIEPNRKTSFKPESFTIDNLSNTPTKTHFINFIADSDKNNSLKRLKIELINNFHIKGGKSNKVKSINHIAICKENDNLFEIVNNTNSDITKASSSIYNNNNVSAAKNIKDRNYVNGIEFASFNNTNDKNIDFQINLSKNNFNNTNSLSQNFQSNDLTNKDLSISWRDKNSKYKKNILHNLDVISVAKYEINPNIPLDPIFYDILCINCYECVKAYEVDFHSEYCIINSDERNYSKLF